MPRADPQTTGRRALHLAELLALALREQDGRPAGEPADEPAPARQGGRSRWLIALGLGLCVGLVALLAGGLRWRRRRAA